MVAASCLTARGHACPPASWAPLPAGQAGAREGTPRAAGTCTGRHAATQGVRGHWKLLERSRDCCWEAGCPSTPDMGTGPCAGGAGGG